MNFDDLLKDTWQGETRQAAPAELADRVRRQRQRHRLQRAIEIALTLVAVLVFGYALWSGDIGPIHWLLLPFFMVYLPMAWALILRTPRSSHADVAENTRLYARLRMSQLRTRLRDLWLARVAAWSLLAYVIAANAAVWVFGNADWRVAGMTLLGFAVVWIGATFWFSHSRRRASLREYRAMRSLAGT